jgi:hypothetical protein
MTEQAIELLKNQAMKLDAKDFDLKGWKKHTVLLLQRIFGEKDPKIAQIEQLDFEFSSWSLRDASGNESYEAGRKRVGREILEAAISELMAFGMPGKEKNNQDATLALKITSLLFDELKGSQVKQIRQLIQSVDNDEETKRRLSEIIDNLDKDTLVRIMAGMLITDGIVQSLKD